MKVHELVTKLLNMPQSMEVFVYSPYNEGDDSVTDVRICSKNDRAFAQMKGYYCQADSMAAIYLDNHPEENKVVVIGF